MQTNKPDISKSKILLNCLEGQPAPPLVIEGWKLLSAFPGPAWEPFWGLLAPVLMNPDSSANKKLLSLFCTEYKIQPENTLAAIGCCELLLRQAAALDLSEDAFQSDIEALTDDNAIDLVQFISARFPIAKKGLRQQILDASLAAHGKVMTGLEWRLDKVQHSSKGARLNSDIVLLTLEYKEGQNQNKITLQLTKEAGKKLKGFCDRLIDPNDTR